MWRHGRNLWELADVGVRTEPTPRIPLDTLSPAAVAGSPSDDSHVATGMLVKVVWIKGPAILVLRHCGTGRRDAWTTNA